MMFSASASSPWSCKERPIFFPAASTFFPARLKTLSKRSLRSFELRLLNAKFHHASHLGEARDPDYGRQDVPRSIAESGLYTGRKRVWVEGQTRQVSITSE